MKTTAEMKLEITNGRIIGAEVTSNGTCKLTIEIAKDEDSSKSTFDIFTKQDDPDFDWK